MTIISGKVIKKVKSDRYKKTTISIHSKYLLSYYVLLSIIVIIFMVLIIYLFIYFACF